MLKSLKPTALAVVAFTALSAPAFAQSAGVQNFTFSENELYRIQATEGFISSIELSAGEFIEAIQIGNSEDWEVVRLNSGDQISVKPLVAGARTNLIVSTDRDRVYSFVLQSVAERANRQPIFRNVISDPVVRVAAPAPVVAAAPAVAATPVRASAPARQTRATQPAQRSVRQSLFSAPSRRNRDHNGRICND